MLRTHRCTGVRPRSVSNSATTATRNCLSCLLQLGVAGLAAFVATSIVGSGRPVGVSAARLRRFNTSAASPAGRRHPAWADRTQPIRRRTGTLSELRPAPGGTFGCRVGVRVPRQPRGLINDPTLALRARSSRPPRPDRSCGRPSPALPNYSPRSGFSRGPAPSWPPERDGHHRSQ
jgi:hypothetical protein